MMIKKFFASLLILFLINYAVLIVLIFNLDRTYLNDRFYYGQVSEKISHLLIDYNVSKVYMSNTSEKSDFSITKEDFVALMNMVYSPDFVFRTIQETLNKLKSYNQSGKFTISFNYIKENSDVFTTNFVNKLITKLPPCDTTSSDTVKNCIPNGADKKELAAKLKQEIETQLFDYLPAEIVIDEKPQVKEILMYLNMIYNDLPIIKIFLVSSAAFILILIALIIFRPLKDIAHWEGHALLWSGITLLLTGFGIQRLISSADTINQYISKETIDNVLFFSQFLIKDYYSIGAALIIPGLLLYIGGYFLKPNAIIIEN